MKFTAAGGLADKIAWVHSFPLKFPERSHHAKALSANRCLVSKCDSAQ